MTDIQIRCLRPGETDLFRATRLRALRDAPQAFGGRYEDEAAHPPSYWEGLIARPRSTILLAMRGADTIGMIFIFAREAGEGGIGGMWVAPEARRMGVAARLVERALIWAAEDGLETVSLWNAANNPAAEGFYLSLGFAPTGRTKPLESNPEVNVVEYAKNVIPISQS